MFINLRALRKTTIVLKNQQVAVMDLNHLKNSRKQIFINRSNYLSLHQNCFLFNVFARINKRSILMESEWKSEEVTPLVRIANDLLFVICENICHQKF